MIQPTIPPMPKEKDDRFKITPDEVEELIKKAKEAQNLMPMVSMTPVMIKSCSHLLPCGICDRTNQICSQYL